MKHKVKTFIKRFKFIYGIYYLTGNMLINLLKIFIKSSDKTVLFVSYGGKKYDDSPKVIYESMINDSRFDDYDFVWAFIDIDEFNIKKGRKIKIDTFKYYITALKSRVWITNSGIERGLNFKGKKTLYINTWHGTPLKKMGKDIPNNNISFKTNAESKVDIMLAQGTYEVEKFAQAYDIELSKFKVFGLPRNDELLNMEYKKKEILEKLDIKSYSSIILYAPTFREYERDIIGNCTYNSPFDFKKVYEHFGENIMILLRMHYEISDYITIDDTLKKNVLDVSKYDNLNELLTISDILITDYSSIMFDYSIMKKPIVTYTYDFKEYWENRGLYFDIRKELPNSNNMNELIKILEDIELNYEFYCDITDKFRKKFIDEFGHSTKKIIDEIYDMIN